LNKFFYVNHIQIIQKIENILNTKIKIDLNFRDQVLSKSHDIPNKDFSGPF
jgi:hypothetical protein